MAERETGNGGVGADSDSITAFCFDTAHQLFGSVKTRDPFVINKLLDAENQGRGNRNRNNNVTICKQQTFKTRLVFFLLLFIKITYVPYLEELIVII